jgi:hypothetical protein
MKRVNLPSGAHADLRHVTDITERHRRPLKKLQTELLGMADFAATVEKAQGNKKLSKAEQDALAAGLKDSFEPLEELNDRLVVAVVAGWSYDFPVSYDTILDLPVRDLDALREHVAPYMEQLSPNFSPQKDKNSPTGV